MGVADQTVMTWRRLARGALAVLAFLPLASTASLAGDPPRPPSPPRSVTYTSDRHYYASPWYDGAWQEMIPFGCTSAPYYRRDWTCPRSRPGRHHGIDMFMPCGTKLRSAVAGVVVAPRLGSAYGRYGLKIRAGRHDYVIGHAQRLYVRPGNTVRPGQLIARSGRLAAPDGCHLHFEVRPKAGGYLDAVRPGPYLRLHRRR